MDNAPNPRGNTEPAGPADSRDLDALLELVQGHHQLGYRPVLIAFGSPSGELRFCTRGAEARPLLAKLLQLCLALETHDDESAEMGN